jgi:hypothetical protein
MRTAAVRDAIVEMPDGAWLLPLCGLRTRFGIPEVAELEAWTAFVVRSTDQGRRWSYWGTMGHDPVGVRSFWEPGLLRRRDGRLIGMLRAHHYPRLDPVELTGVGHLFVTDSDDDGASWGVPRRTDIVGHPADLIQLADGRVLCTFGRRVAPLGVGIALSQDGETWDAERTAVLRSYTPPDRPGPPVPGFPYHIGYPTTIQLDDGRLLSAYHLFNEARRQYVEAAIYELAD